MGVPGGEPVRLAGYLAEPRLVDSVVRELQAIQRTSGLERTVAIGALVLNRFFGGSVVAWRDRRKNKNNSVRRLAEHPECPLSRAAINQSIGVFVIVQALPCVHAFKHIGAAHVAAVFHLDGNAQREWLERAEQRAWGVRQLRSEITRQRRETGERRGRPRTTREREMLANIRRHVANLENDVDHLVAALHPLRDRAELERIVARLAAVESAILRAVQSFRQSEPRIKAVGVVKPGVSNPLEEVG
jgi:hypothetical protein